MSANGINISEADVKTFQNDGAICLRGVLSDHWLKKAAVGIEKTKQNPSQYSENLKAASDSGYYFNDYCNWQNIAEFKELALDSMAPQLAAKLMKSQTTTFYHEHVLTKDAGTSLKTPWHHDQAYYPIDGDKNLSMWIPIDPVAEEATIEFVAGSHRWGRWFHPRKFATNKNYVVESDDKHHAYEDIPDIDGDKGTYKILKWAVQPGDIVIFHMRTLHGAPSNVTATPRRIVSLRYLGDDCVLARRPWTVSPPITGDLQYGDKVMCDTFPLAWSETKA